MNDIFTTTDTYRKEFIDVLKKSNKYFNSDITEYITPSKKYKIKYAKWNHPYQGDWEKTAIFTDDILDFLKSIINPNSVVIDVGAQAGLMSVAYAQFAKKVISFEPNPATFDVLEKNSKIHENIIPYNFACSTKEDVLTFHYSDEGFCNGGFATNCAKGIGVTGHNIPMDVYAINLYDFLQKYHSDDINNISFIKIDAEGHDKDIIKTLHPMLMTTKPILITEIYAGLTPYEINELIVLIHNASYTIYNVGKINEGLADNTKRVKINNYSDIATGEHGDLLCFPKK